MQAGVGGGVVVGYGTPDAAAAGSGTAGGVAEGTDSGRGEATGGGLERGCEARATAGGGKEMMKLQIMKLQICSAIFGS